MAQVNREGVKYYFEWVEDNWFQLKTTEAFEFWGIHRDEQNLISSVDPSGGPFLDVGGTVFPTEFKNGPLSVGTISKIELRENGLFVEILQ